MVSTNGGIIFYLLRYIKLTVQSYGISRPKNVWRE